MTSYKNNHRRYKTGEVLKESKYEEAKSTKAIERRVDRRIYRYIKNNYELFMTTWGGRGG